MRNKYKFTAVTAALALGLVLTTAAFAQTDSSMKDQMRTAKMQLRATRSKAIEQLLINQTKRAAAMLDRMQAILDRIKIQREKLTGPAANFTSLDDSITEAEAQIKTTQTAIDDLKTKADALNKALAPTTTNTDLAAPTQPVKTFMASVKTLKQDMIALHGTLRTIIKEMKVFVSPTSEDSNTNNNTSNTGTSAGEENE